MAILDEVVIIYSYKVRQGKGFGQQEIILIRCANRTRPMVQGGAKKIH
jgi:hypothetical protein